jgi:hypothetical protein
VLSHQTQRATARASRGISWSPTETTSGPTKSERCVSRDIRVDYHGAHVLQILALTLAFLGTAPTCGERIAQARDPNDPVDIYATGLVVEWLKPSPDEPAVSIAPAAVVNLAPAPVHSEYYDHGPPLLPHKGDTVLAFWITNSEGLRIVPLCTEPGRDGSLDILLPESVRPRATIHVRLSCGTTNAVDIDPWPVRIEDLLRQGRGAQ